MADFEFLSSDTYTPATGSVSFNFETPPEPNDPVYFRQFQHLLPQCRAWNIDIEGKNLTNFFHGLELIGADIRKFFDGVWSDIFPTSTREITMWEKQFGLTDSSGLTEADRRQRLVAAWTGWGGQSASYLQTLFQAFGFDVYLHEWWEPGTESMRDPFTYLNPTYLPKAGDDPAKGYPLVNKISATVVNYLTGCGETIMECGNPGAECGNFNGFINIEQDYTIPSDPTKYPYFLYVGAATFPNKATVPAARRNEFEALLLKYCPAQQWIGVLVNYV